MTTNISTGDLFQGGRISTVNREVGQAYLRYANTFANGEEYIFNFPSATSTANTFGIVRSVFVDNALNNYPMNVIVSGTRQSFPVPANSSGWYGIDAQEGSTISITSTGLASGLVEVIFYNYERTPFVWYKFGTTNVSVAIPDGADVAMGSTTDAPNINAATNGTLISFTKGIVARLTTLIAGINVFGQNGTSIQSIANPFIVGGTTGSVGIALKTDASGRLEVIGSAAGNSVYGPDAVGAAPTQAPIYVSGKYNTTLPTMTNLGIANLQTGARGSLNVQIMDANGTAGVATQSSGADTLSNSAIGLNVYSRGSVFNGTSWDRQYGNTAGTFVQGNVASAATDSGNPVKVGAIYNSTLPTFTNGQRGDLQLTARGGLYASIASSTGQDWGFVATNVDGVTPSSVSTRATVANYNYVYNGTSFDRQRGDTEGTFTKTVRSTSGGPANVSTSTANATLIASNTNRKGGTIYNDATANLYVKLGATASATSFHTILQPGGYYEVPFNYTGIIDGILASGTGTARIGEFT